MEAKRGIRMDHVADLCSTVRSVSFCAWALDAEVGRIGLERARVYFREAV